MPGKHLARVGRQSRARRGRDRQKRMAGGQSNSARKLEDIAESLNLLQRPEYSCKLCGGKVSKTATMIIVVDGVELWVCKTHGESTPLLPGRVFHDTFELYSEA